MNEATTIASMANAHNISISTLLFFERFGLLHPRRVGEIRFYSPKDHLRVKVILKGQQLGFSLHEVKRLVEMAKAGGDEPPLTCTCCESVV